MSGINHATYAVVLIALYGVALAVFYALDWIRRREQRKQRLASAVAAQHVADTKEQIAREYEHEARRSMQLTASEPKIPIYISTANAPMQLDRPGLKAAWFEAATKAAARRDWGAN